MGRSDGVLNPSGVRFGSAEIYNVVEKFSFINDSICVGQRRPNKDTDERVLLFVTIKDGGQLTAERVSEVKKAIAKAHSQRHVPAHIFQVQGIPVTLTGKKTELAVKAVVCGNSAFKPSSVSWLVDSTASASCSLPFCLLPRRQRRILELWKSTSSMLILRACWPASNPSPSCENEAPFCVCSYHRNRISCSRRGCGRLPALRLHSSVRAHVGPLDLLNLGTR